METKITEILGIKYEYYVKDCMAGSCIGVNKVWEPHITNFVKLYNKLYTIQNIVDIGANFGYHTLLFSKEVTGKVYAFEPQLQNFQLLKNNVEHNNINNIDIYNLACGDTNCDIKMSLILDTSETINMGDFTANLLKTDLYSETKSIILDDMNLHPIDLIKIDVQGWEKKVLLGTINILQKYKPILIVEFEECMLKKTNTSSKELFTFLKENNYYIFFLDYEYPSDHVCVHKDNLENFMYKFKDYIYEHNTDNYVNHNIFFGVNKKILIK
jgi:FkbM family methyltransferase